MSTLGPTDVFTPAERSAVMARVKGKDTRPELKLRRALHGLGYRYRLHAASLPGKPDLVFAGRRVALFVHGCFWHGHDCPRGARLPKANADYWSTKIARTRTRDAGQAAALIAAGWRVVVVWECALTDADVVDRVRAALDADDHPTKVELDRTDPRGPRPC